MRTPNDDFKRMLVLAEQEESVDVRLGMFRTIAHLSVSFNEGMIAQLMEDDDSEQALPDLKDDSN